jgi:hypothetical protein
VSVCTWKECQSEASVPQVAADGEIWANLCVEHDEKLAGALDDPLRMLSYWVLAQGGSQSAALRMTREFEP